MRRRALGIALGLAGMGLVLLGVRQDYASDACQTTGDGMACGGGPGDPLIVVGIVGLTTGILVAVAGGELLAEVVAWRIRRHGRDATATIVAVASTSLTINDVRQVRLRLRVEPPDGGAPFQAELRTDTSPSLRSGERVAVRYDPASPSRVVLLDRPATAGARPGGPDS